MVEGSSVRTVRGLRAFLVAVAVFMAACGGDAAPLQAAVDSISVPPKWLVAKSVVQGNGGCIALATENCPSVFRYYTADGALPELFLQAKDALVGAGFVITHERSPNCDLLTNGSPCSISATKANVQLSVDFYRAGEDVDSQGVAIADHATVRIIVRPG